jgi:hypothetical protein
MGSWEGRNDTGSILPEVVVVISFIIELQNIRRPALRVLSLQGRS